MDTTLRLRHLLPFILTLLSLLSCDGEQGVSAVERKRATVETSALP